MIETRSFRTSPPCGGGVPCDRCGSLGGRITGIPAWGGGGAVPVGGGDGVVIVAAGAAIAVTGGAEGATGGASGTEGVVGAVVAGATADEAAGGEVGKAGGIPIAVRISCSIWVMLLPLAR